MKAYLLTLFILILPGCITGNPWEQFMTNIEHNYKDKDFTQVKNYLAEGGRQETTPEKGYTLPNGNRQHEIDWGSKNGATCTLILEVENDSNKIIAVGGKGGMHACQWGG